MLIMGYYIQLIDETCGTQQKNALLFEKGRIDTREMTKLSALLERGL